MRPTAERTTALALEALLHEQALAGQWVLDPNRSSIRLRNKSMWGLVPVSGEFREVGGHGTVSAEGEVSGTITVVSASIDTGNPKRDTHLRSADFFDSAHNPDITFRADGIRPSGDGVGVTGFLTVRDRTRPMTFDAKATVQGNGEVWLDADVHVSQADFGLTWNLLGTVGQNNTLTIHAVFTRP
ncbi:MAG TPA: YceI family protein [Streptosporangiaceae bacterium]|nr:YceI family protein [Streptosporangiaceae bacterium]